MKKQGKIYLASKYTYELIKPEEAIVINIARKPMPGIIQALELAPSKELFSWFQKNKEIPNWFDEYKRRYKYEIQSNEIALQHMRHIKEQLLKGIDIVLFCYCRDVYKCHRSIIGEAYEAVGIEVIYK